MGLDEVNAFPLVCWREASAAASANDTRTDDARAIGGTRSKQGTALEGGDRLTAQHTRQFDPLRAANTRASLDQLCRHFRHRRPSGIGLTVRHLPYCHPDLGTGSKTPACDTAGIDVPLPAFYLLTERTLRSS